MADVGEVAGVSKNAVSLAFRHDPQIPVATRDRIFAAARKIGYRYDPHAGDLLSRVRAGGQAARSTLAVVHAHADKNAWKAHPTIPTYLTGVRRRAEERGYGTDLFWLHDQGVRGEALARILRSRGIRGVVVVGMMRTNQLPDHFLPVIEGFSCVVTGVRTRAPALPFACVDHYDLSRRAMEHALSLGYRRPGLVLDETIDHLVDGRFGAGYRRSQEQLPGESHLQPFYQVQAARSNPAVFADWVRREKPDMIFTLYHEVRRWLEGLSLRVPEDVGLAQLEWRPNHPDWAGMDQHNDLAGEAAVDMLLGMMLRGERGSPQFPRAFLMGSSWKDGHTLPRRAVSSAALA
jgi:LacI family transcriptional regulator